MTEVGLEELTRETVRAVCDLRLGPGQDRYVAPAAVTVAEAGYYDGSWLRAITVGGRPVGVVWMLPSEDDPAVPYVVRFMVDVRHQRRGIGRAALEQVAEHWRAAGAPAIELSYQPGPETPAPFYARCGFTETGAEHHGERVARRELG